MPGSGPCLLSNENTRNKQSQGSEADEESNGWAVARTLGVFLDRGRKAWSGPTCGQQDREGDRGSWTRWIIGTGTKLVGWFLSVSVTDYSVAHGD